MKKNNNMTSSEDGPHYRGANPQIDPKDLEADVLEDHRLRLERNEYDAELRYIQAEKTRAALVARRKTYTAILLFLGTLSVLAGLYGPYVFIDRWPLVLGAALLLAALLLVTSVSGSRSFLDVDRARRLFRPLDPADAWPFPTGSGATSHDDDDTEEISALEWEDRHISPEKTTRARLESDPFGAYFYDLKRVLESKADDADAKASILLDKGTGYTKLGIWFFVASIIAWQALSWIHGFQSYFIYGIASCSGLFIFIEFISAWFLKQYRQYVDTSTYLLRVKAIFDRYMLVYLATKTDELPISDNQHRRSEMLIELLSREITWPESYLQKKQDTGFAGEAMEAITLLTKELRSRREHASTKPPAQ